MHGTRLSSLIERIVTRATPLVVVSAAVHGIGCCPPTRYREVRDIRSLPKGWTYQPGHSYLETAEGIYVASPDSPDLSQEECITLCGQYVNSCELVAECDLLPPPVAFDGTHGADLPPGSMKEQRCDLRVSGKPVALRVVCEVSFGESCGRRPPGMRITRRANARTLGGFLAGAYRLEAASIDAFDILARELAHHGAPRAFVRSARAARHDEARHARAMDALARRHGARPRTKRRSTPVPARAARSLAAIAVENAREGCVRETFGALLASWQAHHAEDARVRAAFARIAPEEARHAALAHRIDAWVLPRLGTAARARVARARRDALTALARALAAERPSELVRAAGFPPAHVATHLLHELVTALRLDA